MPPFRWAVPPLAAAFAALFTVVQPLLARMIGVVSWGGCFCGGRAQAWPIGLTVMVWHTAIAVVFGALVGRLMLRRTDRTWLELLKALLGAVGGTMFALPFVAALAGRATVSGTSSPGLQMALAIPVGAVLGVFLGLVVFRVVAIAPALWVHMAWIWLLGFISVVLSWGDEVRQSVPLGAAYVGGPGTNAQPIEQTSYEVTLGALKLLAFLGPIVIAAALAWHAIRSGYSNKVAWASGLLGPVTVLAAYLARPDALTGDNSQWFSFGLRALLLAVIATAATCMFASMFRHKRDGEPPKGPVVNVRINPRSR